MTPTTRKSGVIVVLAASQMTSSTKFSGVKSEFPGVFTPKMPLMAILTQSIYARVNISIAARSNIL